MLNAQTVKQIGKTIGFDLVGITSARPLADLAPLLGERQQKGWQSPFVTGTIAERTDPRLFFPAAQSVVMVALNYYQPGPKAKPGTGRISRSAWGMDYHQVLDGKLKELGQSLQDLDEGFRYRSFADTGPLVERELARRAGLGWIGKNGNLLTPEFGSWVFLGGMAVNRWLETDEPVAGGCGDCQLCVGACPAGALAAPYSPNPHRCLSYLTQKKGCLNPEERVLLDNRLFGCDTCQEICPYNRQRAQTTKHREFRLRGHENPELSALLQLNKKEFQAVYGPTAAGWRGRTTLLRNAVIALGNGGKKQAAKVLRDQLQSPAAVIAEHAAWAIQRLQGSKEDP